MGLGHYSELSDLESGSCYPSLVFLIGSVNGLLGLGLLMAHMASKAISRYFSLSFYGLTDVDHEKKEDNF